MKIKRSELKKRIAMAIKLIKNLEETVEEMELGAREGNKP